MESIKSLTKTSSDFAGARLPYARMQLTKREPPPSIYCGEGRIPGLWWRLQILYY